MNLNQLFEKGSGAEKGHGSGTSGFTLIELVVSIGILILFLVMFGLSLNRTVSSTNARVQMNTLAAYFSDARALAAASGGVHHSGSTLQFDYDPKQDRTTVTVYQYRPYSSGGAVLPSVVAERDLQPLLVSGRVAVGGISGYSSGNQFMILFGTSGSVDFADGIVSQVQSAQGRTPPARCGSASADITVSSPSPSVRHLTLSCYSGDLQVSG